MKALFRLLFATPREPANDIDAIVAGFLGRGEAFSDQSRLYHDLRIYGDDACELLEEVRERFGTEFSGFVFSRYFPNETDGMFFPLAAMFGCTGRFMPFTVGHLRAIAVAGRWFDPEPETPATPANPRL